MAAAHAGITERFDCEKCKKAPILKKLFGCDPAVASSQPVFEIEIGENIIEFYNCPILFVSSTVHHFYKQYRYQKDFPSAPMPEYEDCNKLWLDYVAIYEQYYNKFEKEMLDRITNK